jgi:peroxiredoxin
MKRISLFLLIFIFCIKLSFAQTIGTGIGNLAPNFKLKSTSGNITQLSDYKKKQKVLLSFWATWCPACTYEIPRLKEIYEQFTSYNLKVLAINIGINETYKNITRFQKRHELPYEVLLDNGSLVKKYNVIGIPTNIIVDEEGKIIFRDNLLPENEQLNDFLKIDQKSKNVQPKKKQFFFF